MSPLTGMLLAGAVTGAGVFVLINALLPPVPDLRAALARLDTTPTPPAPDRVGVARWLPAQRLDAAAAALGLDRHQVELRLLDETATGLLVRKAGYALLGLAFPALLATALLMLWVSIPVTVPTAVGLLLAGVLFFAPDLDLHRRAATARDTMRRTVCVYIDLVALERAADAGPSEALHRAATLTDSGGLARIAAVLRDAEIAGRPAWTGLADLGDDLGIVELCDLADIMTLSGIDGAAVYTTLRARAASLRTQLLTAAAARANAASEHMIVPVALLGVVFMALIGYPAFARILFSP